MPRRALCSLLLLLGLLAGSAGDDYPPVVHLTAEEDHQRMLDLLHITSLRRGPDGDPKSPNAANFDESKVDPHQNLPDPLRLNDGKRVTTAKMWWRKRRPEIVELFDREIFGRVPQGTPKVNWEISSTSEEQNGSVSVVTKKLVGHVDNRSYPPIQVDIQLTLSTPAKATGPVPVMRSALSSCLGGGPEGTITVGGVPAVPAGERSWAGMDAIALWAAALGADVVLVDAGLAGRATAAGAGIICPWSARVDDPAWYEFGRTAARNYPALIGELAELGQTNTGYRRVGALALAQDEGDRELIRRTLLARQAQAPEMGDVLDVSGTQARQLFPPLRDDAMAVYK